MASKKIVLRGQPVGRFGASWILFKESFRFFRADPEMMWIPLITTILNLVLFGALVSLFVFGIYGGDLFVIDSETDSISPIQYAFIFLAYVISAFTLALSQAGITHIVYTRIRGGDATLGQGLSSAFSHWFSLLLWSVITSTVGLILRMIAERSKILGKIVVLILGVAWSVLTYFVVPAMVIDKHSAFASIGKSSRVFKTTWGETLVTNISIGLVFFIAHVFAILVLIGLIIASMSMGLEVLVFVSLGLYVLWVIASSLVQSSLAGVIKTLLYVYASEQIIPENFDSELLEKMLSRKGGIPASPVAADESRVDTNTNQTQQSPMQ